MSSPVRKPSAAKQRKHSVESFLLLHALSGGIGQQLSEELLLGGDGILCYKQILFVGSCDFA